jgi:AbrB family looped-hinge helix DNA binding protein
MREVKKMRVSRVTDKFQVTIPKDVRDSIGLRPGERVMVEQAPGGTIVVKRFKTVKDPLNVLLGKKSIFRKSISQNKLEEMMEQRD